MPLTKAAGAGKPDVPVRREQELKAACRVILKHTIPRVSEGRTHELTNSLARAYGGGLEGVEAAHRAITGWVEDRVIGVVSENRESYLRGGIVQERRHGHDYPPHTGRQRPASRYGLDGSPCPSRYGFNPPPNPAQAADPHAGARIVGGFAEEVA